MSDSPQSPTEITVTEKALAEIRRIIKANNMPETTAVRFQVKGGGCSGFSYNMEFTDGTKVDQSDRVMEAGGVKVICDVKSFLFIKGMTVDFADSILSRQFVFKNPNAKSTCGCGTSFSV